MSMLQCSSLQFTENACCKLRPVAMDAPLVSRDVTAQKRSTPHGKHENVQLIYTRYKAYATAATGVEPTTWTQTARGTISAAKVTQHIAHFSFAACEVLTNSVQPNCDYSLTSNWTSTHNRQDHVTGAKLPDNASKQTGCIAKKDRHAVCSGV